MSIKHSQQLLQFQALTCWTWFVLSAMWLLTNMY